MGLLEVRDEQQDPKKKEINADRWSRDLESP
jgi:hypothetical protein